MTKRYAVIGDLIAEQRGSETVVGGAGAIALGLRELGGEVTLRSRVGTDPAGKDLLGQIKAARIHPGMIDLVDETTSTLTRLPDGGISDWHEGVLMTMDGRIDTFGLFKHSAMVVDLLDQRLRNFIIDLPVHQDGTVRMLTTLRHLDHMELADNDLENAMRCDTIVGTEAQLTKLTGEADAASALGLIFELMPGAHVRAAVAITPNGLDIVARDTRVLKPVQNAVPNLLIPQVVAGIAWGMANHADWDRAATVAVDPTAVEA